jgi:hypothetical protein
VSLPVCFASKLFNLLVCTLLWQTALSIVDKQIIISEFLTLSLLQIAGNTLQHIQCRCKPVVGHPPLCHACLAQTGWQLNHTCSMSASGLELQCDQASRVLSVIQWKYLNIVDIFWMSLICAQHSNKVNVFIACIYCKWLKILTCSGEMMSLNCGHQSTIYLPGAWRATVVWYWQGKLKNLEKTLSQWTSFRTAKLPSEQRCFCFWEVKNSQWFIIFRSSDILRFICR